MPVNRTGRSHDRDRSTNVFAMDDIKFMTGYHVEPVVASEIATARRSDAHGSTNRPSSEEGHGRDGETDTPEGSRSSRGRGDRPRRGESPARTPRSSSS